MALAGASCRYAAAGRAAGEREGSAQPRPGAPRLAPPGARARLRRGAPMPPHHVRRDGLGGSTWEGGQAARRGAAPCRVSAPH